MSKKVRLGFCVPIRRGQEGFILKACPIAPICLAVLRLLMLNVGVSIMKRTDPF